ncbi:AraC family transcriptional regulator [Streptomyces sp. LBUM 1483]|nr:AraC family transcriptional regulator [Streptomyces sp. LBUM 1483]
MTTNGQAAAAGGRSQVADGRRQTADGRRQTAHRTGSRKPCSTRSRI